MGAVRSSSEGGSALPSHVGISGVPQASTETPCKSSQPASCSPSVRIDA
jgi:hypothetical protein